MVLWQFVAAGILLAVIFYLLYDYWKMPSTVRQLVSHWNPKMVPPKLSDKVVVYVSAPLFNLSETLYAVGLGGITPAVQVSLVDTLCSLTDTEMKLLTDLSGLLEIPYYGIAGLIAAQGWYAYIPARDGFVLAKYMAAIGQETGPGKTLTAEQSANLSSYMIKAIYGNDVYGLGVICNTCIFNGNGLQVDDGSATEIGMCGIRGMPSVIFRDQLTDQFGPGASNPMPLGNASSIITQRAYKITDAVNLLKQKVENIKQARNNWWSGLDYTATVPPPPLVQYWMEVGSAVYLTRYKTKLITTDANGMQDYKANSTDFFYKNYFQDGSSKALVAIALKIQENIQAIERKWAQSIPVFAGCKDPANVTIDYIQKTPTACSPGS